MIRILSLKLKEALTSVLPVTAIVLLLNLTPLVHLTGQEVLVFSVSAVMLILGMGLFNLGADMAMTPMGEQVGAGLSKSRSLGLLLAVCFVMGVFITVAEPDLSVLATQVAEVMNGTLMIVTVGIGVGLFLVLAILKIVFRKSLASMLMFFYMLLFALASFVVINGNADFLPMAFDSGGVTTGPITVPFIMALGVGVAATLGGKDAGENSFGLVALCSIGPILAVMALGISIRGEITYALPDYSITSHIGANFLPTLGGVVKEVALAHGTPVFQPRTLRDGSEDENIRALAPELIVVVAYGCILPKSVLEMPRYGCINLHVSLLPKYRGSAPVQWSVLNGDAETGVSIMQMDEGLDTGDVLYCKKIAIDPEETSGELFDRVTAVGAEALCETISQIAAGTLTAVPQDHENATLAPMLNKEMAEFHLTDSAAHIHNWVRGMNPWPGAWFITSGGKKLKVMSCRVAAANGEAPGTVLATKPLTIACGEGAIQLLEVVPEGKKPMDGTAFAAGLRLKTGDSL